ncbi:hypothetical protein LWI29_014730 [Acer saccharum]|uniref:Uncharacterized protein n=1 Tax=Acer saccharum TaxID=4024 RepID=A0AA39W2W9_ACESA|nr:hypothetical protein LWI29_014730 [Acer saccharum]
MAKAHVHAVVEGCMLVTERENIISYGEECLFINDWAALCVVSGGWPMPLKLRGFCMVFKREACVRQSCRYLEFLGGQVGAGPITSEGLSSILDVSTSAIILISSVVSMVRQRSKVGRDLVSLLVSFAQPIVSSVVSIDEVDDRAGTVSPLVERVDQVVILAVDSDVRF